MRGSSVTLKAGPVTSFRPASSASRARHRNVQGTLPGQGQRAVRAGYERVDRRPVQLLDAPHRDGPVEHVDGDAHDLALLLTELGDGVDERPLREREADHDLVDDLLVQRR